jgi:hypothetical protein
MKAGASKTAPEDSTKNTFWTPQQQWLRNPSQRYRRCSTASGNDPLGLAFNAKMGKPFNAN